MLRQPPRSTPRRTPFPYNTLFRSSPRLSPKHSPKKTTDVEMTDMVHTGIQTDIPKKGKTQKSPTDTPKKSKTTKARQTQTSPKLKPNQQTQTSPKLKPNQQTQTSPKLKPTTVDTGTQPRKQKVPLPKYRPPPINTQLAPEYVTRAAPKTSQKRTPIKQLTSPIDKKPKPRSPVNQNKKASTSSGKQQRTLSLVDKTSKAYGKKTIPLNPVDQNNQASTSSGKKAQSPKSPSYGGRTPTTPTTPTPQSVAAELQKERAILLKEIEKAIADPEVKSYGGVLQLTAKRMNKLKPPKNRTKVDWFQGDLKKQRNRK